MTRALLVFVFLGGCTVEVPVDFVVLSDGGLGGLGFACTIPGSTGPAAAPSLVEAHLIRPHQMACSVDASHLTTVSVIAEAVVFDESPACAAPNLIAACEAEGACTTFRRCHEVQISCSGAGDQNVRDVDYVNALRDALTFEGARGPEGSVMLRVMAMGGSCTSFVEGDPQNGVWGSLSSAVPTCRVPHIHRPEIEAAPTLMLGCAFSCPTELSSANGELQLILNAFGSCQYADLVTCAVQGGREAQRDLPLCRP